MNQLSKNTEAESSREVRVKPPLTTRGKVAKALATMGLGAVVGIGGEHIVMPLIHGAESNVHQADESGYYSQRNLYDKMHQNGGFDSKKVEVVSVGPSDYPQLMATELGAKDIRLVADEISGQEGGADNLHVGDQVVVPKDQLSGLDPK